MLKVDEEYYFYGKIERTLSGLRMIAPTFSPVGQGLGLHAVYNLTAGLSNKQLQRYVKEALKLLPETVNDPIPEFIRKKYNLCDLRKAITDIHFPKNKEDMERARYRHVFEELLTLNLGLRAIKSNKSVIKPIHIPVDYSDEFFSKLVRFANESFGL